MGVEIERKYLVKARRLPGLPPGRILVQGYIRTGSLTSVRVRVDGDRSYLTVKGPSSENGLVRSEFEYAIPPGDARQILDQLCDGGVVEKTRYRLPAGDLTWEVDVFGGRNEGLVMAEVELPDESVDPESPDWIDVEVTGDPRYSNMNLAQRPWPEWAAADASQ